MAIRPGIGTAIVALTLSTAIAQGEATDPVADKARPAGPKPVAKDGIEVTVRPTKAVFAKGETVAFEVSFKNASGAARSICCPVPGQPLSWQFTFQRKNNGESTKRDGGLAPGKWNGSYLVDLEPGKTHTLTVRGMESAERAWRPLDAGKYTVKIKLHINPTAAPTKHKQWWTGTLETEGVEIEVAEK
ncbi:hypothetical protein AYO40_02510 [Planctomycetaceae bacterium SCGC AG-212-D15]|nr:hypothetical protein AYO40_02510 [Planctomycetaceae bacterium SCGC AG-212-D15]